MRISFTLAFALTGCSATGGPTGTGTCTIVEETLFDPRVDALWPMSDGSVVATRTSLGISERSASGVWSDDDDAPAFFEVVEGGGARWGISRSTVWRQTANTDWVELGFESVPSLSGFELTDIAVFSASDVRVVGLRVFEDWETADGTPGYIEELDVEVYRWDGATWSTEVVEDVPPGTRGAGLLPDGRVVLAASGAVWTIDGEDRTRLAQFGLQPESMRIQTDGTLVIVEQYGNGVRFGDEDGLETRNPPDGRVEGAMVASDGTLWVAVSDGDEHAVWAFGGSWDRVYRGSEPVRAIAELPDGDVLFGGGQSGSFVLVGDSSGLTLDRAESAVDFIHGLTADDVTGEAWSLSSSRVGRSDGGPWQPVSVDIPLDRLDPFAVSDQRLVHYRSYADEAHLYVRDSDGDTSGFQLPSGQRISTLCGAEGVLFAWGNVGDDAPLMGFRHAGGSWEPLGEVATGGIAACWAETADEVFMTLGDGDTGRLVRWSSAGASELASIPGRPRWLRRMGDGRLWMLVVQGTGFRQAELWTWDGTALEPQPDIPAGHAMHLAPDGELWAIESGDGPDVLHRRDVDGNWSVLTEGGDMRLVGSGNQIWAARTGQLTWTRDCGGAP